MTSTTWTLAGRIWHSAIRAFTLFVCAAIAASLSAPAHAQDLSWRFAPPNAQGLAVLTAIATGSGAARFVCRANQGSIGFGDIRVWGTPPDTRPGNFSMLSVNTPAQIIWNGSSPDYRIEPKRAFVDTFWERLLDANAIDFTFNTTKLASHAFSDKKPILDFLKFCMPPAKYAAMSGSPSGPTSGGAASPTPGANQAASDQPKNCVAYDQDGRPFRVVCPVPGNPDNGAASGSGTGTTSSNVAGTTPSQNTPNNPPAANDDSFSAGEAIALGVLAVGAGIIANEINDQFFTEQGAPAAPGGNGQTRITIASVRAIETTFGFGGDEIFLLGSNGTRIPSNGAQDIDAGQTWSPNASVTANGGLSFDLREWDSFNASDQIGNFTIAANTAPGRYTATLRGDGAVYEVTYDVAGGQASSGGSAPPVSTPAPQGRRWSASGSNSDIFVSDCTDCGEDVGMFFACPAIGQPAIVAVPWLATENGPTGLTLPLEMSVGGQRFVYDATLSQPGLVGHVPQFQMNPNDPALEALMAGNAAAIVFDGVQANIGLRGSRSALTTFKAHCGWNNIPVGNQANQGQSMPSSGGTDSGMDGAIGAPPNFVWYASAYQDYEDGNTVGALTYGIPETDAASFTATCYPGRNPNANVSFNTGLRTLQLGDPATLFIQPEGANFQYAGSTFSVGGGSFEGVEAQIALTDPVWQAMMRAQNTFLFGAYGGGEGAAQPVGISSAISQFLETCRAGSGQVSNQGQIQQQNQQSVFGNQTQKQVQLPAPQQGGAIDGSYACSDGSSLQVAASTLGTTEIVNMVRNGTDAYALTRQPAQAVGVSYAGSGLTLTAGAGVIQLAGNGTSLFCQKQ